MSELTRDEIFTRDIHGTRLFDPQGNEYVIGVDIPSGGSGGTVGPKTTRLDGSDDPNAPKSDLGAEIDTAISNGSRYLIVRGAWSWDTDITMSTWNYVPFGISIDATGAYVEYTGTGTMLLNDNSNGKITEQRDGGTLRVLGGYWQATSTPRAAFWLRDGTFNHVNPRGMQGWEDAGNASCVVLEPTTEWCESNYINVESYLCDVTLEGLDTKDPTNKNTSFQDNYVDDLHAGAIQNGSAAMKLQGNWRDCTFANPTGITASADAALFGMEANMGNSVIIAPEMEDGGSNVTHYLVKLTADARDGPTQLGGWIEPTDDVTRFDLTNPGSFKWHVIAEDSGTAIETVFRGDGNHQQRTMDAGGFHYRQPDTDANGSFSDVMQVRTSGDVDLKGSGEIRAAGKGDATDPGMRFTGGAGLYVDTNGEIVAVDEAGNTSILT